MATRTYRQMCPIARALDVLGERWTLLVVRELLLGPKRFKELMARLPAMGTNRLSERLKTLCAQGVVERRVLPAPADVAVYELTALGEGLRPIVLGLATWGAELPLDERVDPGTARAELIALGLGARPLGQAGAGLHESYEFRVGDEHFHIDIDDGEAVARSGASSREPAIVVTCDLPTFARMGWGRLTPQQALKSGDVQIAGEPDVLTRAFGILAAARLNDPPSATRPSRGATGTDPRASPPAGPSALSAADLAECLLAPRSGHRRERGNRSRGEQMIVVIGRVSTDADKREALVGIGETVAAASRTETGCISYRVYQATDDEFEFVFVEEWESSEALKRHFATTHIAEFMRAIPTVITAPPDVKFHTVASSMDLAEVSTGD